MFAADLRAVGCPKGGLVLGLAGAVGELVGLAALRIKADLRIEDITAIACPWTEISVDATLANHAFVELVVFVCSEDELFRI